MRVLNNLAHADLRMAAAITRTNRARENFEITGDDSIATGTDEASKATAFELIRGWWTFYGHAPGHWGVLEMHDLGDSGRELNAMSRQGKCAEIANQDFDGVAHLLAAAGTHKNIAKWTERRFGTLSVTPKMRAAEVNTERSAVPTDTVTEQDIPPGLPWDIKRIPTPFKGCGTAW